MTAIRSQLLFLKKFSLIFVLISFSISACQTTNDGGESPNLNPFVGGDYNIFWDQGDHLKDLLKAGKADEAARLFADNKSFFDKEPEKHSQNLSALAVTLNENQSTIISAAMTSLNQLGWPATVADWPNVKKPLQSVDAVLANYSSSPLLADPKYFSAAATHLKQKLAALKARIHQSAPDEFADFNHWGEQSFFADYPVALDKKEFLSKNFGSLKEAFKTASTENIVAFARNYPKEALNSVHWATLGDHFIAASLNAAGKRGRRLSSVFAAIGAARKVGLEPKSVPGLKIGFIEVTSKTLLKQSQIEFPAEVKIDIPVNVAKADLDQLLTNRTVEDADYLIVFDVALAKTRRHIATKKRMPSKFVAAFRTQPNPEYNLAQNQVNQAQIGIQSAAMNSMSASAQFCQGLGCIAKALSQIAAGVAENEAKKNLEASMSGLQSTPMTIEVPVYQNYHFDRATVKATKLMTVRYYVIDRPAKKYFKSTFDVEEKKTFEVTYSVHDKDPDKASHLLNVDTDKTVVAWEEAAASINLSQLVDHYLKNKKRSKPLQSLIALRREMLSDKNVALAKYAATQFDARPLNDPRFSSVVVVYPTNKGRRSLGSGFFVTPDAVLTNWHVVKDATFVELKRYDGQETFGKVIGSDLIRDLALIKVQSRGKPVRFYKKKILDLGATVEAIGHPKGLEFSITRGVVSGLRRIGTVILEKGGGKKTLFIQTDAPVNPGNSGGPLFLGNKVVGVNTMGRKASEGLNFAIHYSEVLEFLRENLAGFQLATN
ncbi:MAG: serine protease Do [Alphaproteobacteria bacterium]|jgi:serine protease Do